MSVGTMSGAGSGFKNISVMLTGNNTNLSSVLRQSGQDVDAFAKRTQSADRTAQGLSKTLKMGLAAGALSVAAGFSYAVVKAAQFDETMRNVNSLAGMSDKALGQVGAQLIEMSKKLPQSANTLAEGLYDITSSGFAGADAMKILRSSAEAASAGLTTTEVSARAIVATLNAYGLQAKDAADVSDTLFQTVNMGVISFDELASNLGDVVGTASAAKVSIQEVGSAIGTMTLSGIGGAEATTSLNALLTKLIQPSKELTALYKQLGYESGASALEQDGLYVVMEKIRKATGGSVEQYMKLFPEIRAARGAFALATDAGANYAGVFSKIADKQERAGATVSTLKEQLKATANQWQLLINNVEAAAITLGMKAVPLLIDLMKAGMKAGDAANEVAAALSSAFGPGAKEVWKIVGDLAEVFGELGSLILDIAEPLAKLGLGAAAAGFTAVATAISAVTGPLADNKEILAALILLWGLNTAGAQKFMNSIMDNAVAGLVGGLDKLEAGGKRMAPVMSDLGTYVHRFGQSSKYASEQTLLARQRVHGYIGAAAKMGALVGAMTLSQTEMGKATGYSNTMMMGAAGAMLGPWGAAIGGSIGFMQDAAESGKEMGEAQEQAKKAFGDVSAFEKQSAAIERMTKIQAQQKKDATDFGWRTFKPTNLADFFTNPTGDYAYKETGRQLDDLEEKYQRNTTTYKRFVAQLQGNGIASGLKNTEDLSKSWNELARVAEAAGIDLEEAIDKGAGSEEWAAAQAALTAYGSQALSTSSRAKRLSDMTSSLNSELTQTEDAADNATKALNGMLDPAINLDQATSAWKEALARVRDELGKNGKSLSHNTAVGRENRDIIRSAVTSLKEKYTAEVEANGVTEKSSRILSRGKDAIIKYAESAGFSKREIKDMLKELNLVGAAKATATVGVKGTDKAKDDLKSVKNAAKDVTKKPWSLEMEAKTGDASGKVKTFAEHVRRMLSNTGIPDAGVNLNLTPKAQQVATQLAELKAVARKHGTNDPGFATGGQVAVGAIRGPGTGTSDSIRALLSNNEHVSTEAEVKAAGNGDPARGHRVWESIRRMALRGELGKMGDAPAFRNGGAVNVKLGSSMGGGLATPKESLLGVRDAGAKVMGLVLSQAISKAFEGFQFPVSGAPLGAAGGIPPGNIMKGLAWAQAQAGKPYIWGSAGPGGYDCSGAQSALTNVLLGSANPNSRRGSTGTFPWSGFQIGNGLYTIGSFKGSPGHMTGNLAGVNIESSGGVGFRYGGGARSPMDSMFTTRAHLSKKRQGGPIYGGSGYADDVPFLGKDGEHVLTTEDVKGLGGHEGVYALRAFASGGSVKFVKSPGKPSPKPQGSFGGPQFSFSYKPFKFRKFKDKDFKFRKRQEGESAKEYEREKAREKKRFEKEQARAKRDYDREKKQARKEYRENKQQARWDKLQRVREDRRLWATERGMGEGAFAATRDAEGTMGNLASAMEARAQATAQRKANASKNPNDTAEDFYKKPTLSVKQMTAALKQSNAVAAKWGADLSKIGKVAGADVANALKGMGEQGEEWVKKLANATTAEMKAMAAELRKLKFQEWGTDLKNDVAGQNQFQANLQQLIARGRSDLAARYAEMGWEEAGQLAAHAATATDAELGQLGGLVTQDTLLSSPDYTRAVKLSAALQAATKPLGVQGLASASGEPLGDILGLLGKYNGLVFSKIPAGKMAQIRADQALINGGKQPSGLAKGGIVLGSAASKGLYYRWAEPGSGGESLIPLGTSNRRRALGLWQETGRLIGARPAGGAGGGTYVADGAVRVDVTIQGSGLSQDQLAAAVAQGTAELADKLAVQIRTGRR